MRFDRQTGAMETIVEGTDEYYATLIGFAVQIESQELPISTYFGAADPVFDERQTNRVVYEASRYIPEVKINSVKHQSSDSGTRELAVSFTRIS